MKFPLLLADFDFPLFYLLFDFVSSLLDPSPFVLLTLPFLPAHLPKILGDVFAHVYLDLRVEHGYI